MYELSAAGAKLTLESSWNQQLMMDLKKMFILLLHSLASFSTISAFDRSFQSTDLCTSDSTLTRIWLMLYEELTKLHT